MYGPEIQPVWPGKHGGWLINIKVGGSRLDAQSRSQTTHGSTIAMAKEGGEVSDAEFRAAFSLLPYVLRLSRVLSTGQTDPQATQKIVSI